MIKKSTLAILLLFSFLSCSGGKEPERSRPEMASRSSDVHIFYYPRYGTPEKDGAFHGWNMDAETPDGRRISYIGDQDIASSFYPAFGCYSSNDPEMLKIHMTQLAASQVGVLCVSWSGKDSYADRAVPGILDAAWEAGLEVNFLIEPFEGRTPSAAGDAIRHIMDKYGSHGAFYRTDRFGEKPMFYVRDSSLHAPDQWGEILLPAGSNTIRKTPYDALVIGMWDGPDDGDALQSAGFDGFFTFSGSHGATYGSTMDNWPHMSQFAWDNGMLFIPTLSPGYDDTRIRPWNTTALRDRAIGEYYRETFRRALAAGTPFISISSFNGWHEGTQIEPAVPKQIAGYTYNNYLSNNVGIYLDLTKQIVRAFSR